MKFTRIYADQHGEAPTADVTLFPQLPPFRVNRFSGPSAVKLFSVPAELNVFDWHTAPERQLAVSLNGIVEYETSDGEVRRFGPGEIVLVEDTTGRGHITRFDGGEQGFLHIPIPADWPMT